MRRSRRGLCKGRQAGGQNGSPILKMDTPLCKVSYNRWGLSTAGCMTTLVEFLHTLLLPIIIFFGAISLAPWWRSRFCASMYVHWIAASSTLVGLLLVWMAWVVNDPLKARVVWLVVIFSALVYLRFGFYGGKIIRKHLLTKEKVDHN
jgi:hypothetical protein